MNLSQSVSPPDISDIRLAAAARAGDKGAMAQLITRYTPMIRKAASGFSGITLDSDDKAQEGMLGFINAVYKYDADNKASFATYAFTCVTNSIRSAIRKLSAAKNSAGNTAVSISDIGEDDIPAYVTPEMQIIEREQYTQLINNLCSALSPLEKKVLSLYLSGYSYSEIAQKLQITVKSADNALCRIRKKLYRQIAETD